MTVVTAGGAYGCGGPTCGAGTKIGPDGKTCVGAGPTCTAEQVTLGDNCLDVVAGQNPCPGGQVVLPNRSCGPESECVSPNIVGGNGFCRASCEATLDCSPQQMAWSDTTDTVRVKVYGPDNCACEAETCKEGYTLFNGRCIDDSEPDCMELLGPGYRNEAGGCVPCTDCTCAEAPSSPACIQVNCEEYPNLVGMEVNGRALCIEAPPPPKESCVNNCHNGIEDPHPWFGGADLTCTGCHGGDAAATTRETAHVALPMGWQDGSAQFGRPNLRYYFNYLTLFGVENFQGGLEWLRFRNPSDLRIAEMSCGKSSGCHQDRVENVKRSVMATEVGLTGGALSRDAVARSVLRGNQGIYKWDATEAMTLGEAELTALKYDSNIVGSMQQVSEFKITDRANNGAYDQVDLLREVYDKQCGDCHLGNAGANNRYADFRTSGCGSCHMVYALDGQSDSTDQMIKKNEPTYPAAWAAIANYNVNFVNNPQAAADNNYLGPERPHPRKHRISRTMASQQCGTCHVGSNRTDWQFRGYRFDPNRDAVLALDNNRLNANQIQFTDEIDNDADANARYHGAAQNQILKYEDWNNDGLDDTPADIHYVAGLECMDCHTSAEMHNELKFVKVAQVTDWADPAQVTDMSGALWSKQDQATEIECVHCHGNLEYRALPHEAENRNPIKNLIVCPEAGETIPGYTPPMECDRLGRGRWLRGKFTGRYHYVSQTLDTVRPGSANSPQGAAVYSLNASIFHGRFNNEANDGVGPCPNGDVNNCYKDQVNQVQQVTTGFSHVGARAQNSVDQHAGGLECYACHSTWVNGCFGCHMTLADNDGNQVLRDFSRSTGELTLGQIAQADFTYIDPLALQFGINSEGKISQFLPETKQGIRHIDQDNNDFFGNRVLVNNDANIAYNIYRHRSGHGTRQYATEQVGLPLNADGPNYEQDAQMDNNAGQGFNQFMPHSVQRAHPLMDCNNCHLDANNNNTAAIQARYGSNANGFGNVSAYLTALDNLQIVRNNTNQEVTVDAAAGFRLDANIDPDAFTVDQQTDWVVLEATGFPLSYNNHPIKEGTVGIFTDPFYNRQYPRMARIAGPLNQALLTKMMNDVRNNNENVQLKGVR